MDRVALKTWVEAYEQAWRTSGTEGLDVLFAEGATYTTAPFENPFTGLSAISAMWEEGRDGPDEAFELESEIVAVEGDTGVVRVEVRYGKPAFQTYRNLWLVRLDDEGLVARPSRSGPSGHRGARESSPRDPRTEPTTPWLWRMDLERGEGDGDAT